MTRTMKRVIAAVILAVMLLSNANMASAVTSDWQFYGDYTDVAVIKDSNSCPSMQGLAVGSQMLYAIKTGSSDTKAVITMTDKDSGTTTTLKDASTGYSYFTGLNHANDMAVWGIDGSSHIFVATTLKGSNAIVRYRRSGSNLYKVATYHLQCNGSDICATAMDVMNVDSSGNIHLITKWGQDIYTGTVHKDTGDTTVNMSKICTISKDMAYIKGEKLNLSSWVNQGFGYYDNTLFVPLSGPDNALHRSVVLVYNLDNVPLGATIYPTDYLAFRVTSGAYSALFEIESVDICSSDGKLYFNTNRRRSDSDTNHDGISSFDGYTYSKPTAASFDAVKHFNAKYLPNGGTGTMAVQRINNGIGTALSKNLYTKTGYTFVGWTAHRLAQNQWYYCTDRSTTGWYAEGKQPSGYSFYIYYDQQKVSATSNVHGDTVEYVAQWTPTNYTVKFDANGGTGTVNADMAFTVENAGKLPAPSFKKDGYTFAGWQVSGLGDILQPGTSAAQLANYEGKGNNTGTTFTLVANWEANDYTVTWNVNGEKFTTTTVKYGQPITAPDYTVSEGHTFSGWNIPATMPAGDITLDATLTVNTYTITWNVNGNITTETYSYGETPSYKGTIENERRGCTVFYFTGWSRNPEKVTGDFTYMAQFTPATSHTQIVTDAAVEPDCSNTGLTEGSHCEACGKVIVEQQVVDAKGHAGDPVYTNNGDTHSAVYPCCGETYVTGQAHSYTDGKCVCQAVQKFTVTIDGNGGRFRYNNTLYDMMEVSAEYGQFLTLPIRTRNQSRMGYTFNGFNTKPDGTGMIYPTNNSFGLEIPNVKSDMTLYAWWQPIQYTANFLPGDGTGEAMPAVKFTIESKETLPQCTYTKEGYTFDKWKISGLSNTLYADHPIGDLAYYLETGNSITLIAQWKPNSYTVTWTINGEEYQKTTHKCDEAITAPEYTVAEGHIFSGWDVPNTMPAGDITLDATLELASYMLTFKDNAGNILSQTTVEYGTAITYPSTEKEGYNFVSWDSDATTMPASDLTITGTWTIKTYDVYLNANSGAIQYSGSLRQTVEHGKTATWPIWNEKLIRHGYTSDHFNTERDGSGDDYFMDKDTGLQITNVTGDMTLYAQWDPILYTVNFLPGEGSGKAMSSIQFTVESKEYLPQCAYEKEGCSFDGWLVSGTNTVFSGNNLLATVTNAAGTGDDVGNTITLIAQWKPNPYTITWTINGEVYDTTTVNYGEPITAPSHTVPEGYIFSGWNAPETMPAENITLDATLAQAGFTITWEVDGKTTKEVYAYGSTPSYKGSTDKASEGCTVYTFTGWDKDITAVTGDITYTAQYTQETKHSETGSWKVNRPATPIAEGEKAWICDTCQEPVRRESIPMVQKLAFSGASLTLQDDLTINYKVNQTLFTDVGYENPYVVFVLNGKEIRVDEYTLVNGKYVFDFANIIPHQMNDTVYATLYATYNGVEYASATREYSVADYCYNMLSKYGTEDYAKFRTLLVDLLNYGAKSQVFMNYNTGELVNAKLTDTQKAWGTSEMRTLVTSQDTAYKTVDSPSVLWKGAGLNLQKSVGMRFKITASNIENLTVRVTNDLGQQSIITSDTFEATEGGYYVFFDGLNAGQMSEVVYLTVYEGNRAVSHTIRYSIESYAYAKQNGTDVKLAELVVAMMKYGDSAKAYANQ